MARRLDNYNHGNPLVWAQAGDWVECENGRSYRKVADDCWQATDTLKHFTAAEVLGFGVESLWRPEHGQGET